MFPRYGEQINSAQIGSSSPVEGEGTRTQPSEREVNMMYRSYADTGGNVNEEIKLLNSISHVSARLARDLTLLAASQSEEEKKMSKMAEILWGFLYTRRRVVTGGT